MKLKLSTNDLIVFFTAGNSYRSYFINCGSPLQRMVIQIALDFQFKHHLKGVQTGNLYSIKLTPIQLLAFNEIFSIWDPTDPFQMAVKADFHQKIQRACLSI